MFINFPAGFKLAHWASFNFAPVFHAPAEARLTRIFHSSLFSVGKNAVNVQSTRLSRPPVSGIFVLRRRVESQHVEWRDFRRAGDGLKLCEALQFLCLPPSGGLMLFARDGKLPNQKTRKTQKPQRFTQPNHLKGKRQEKPKRKEQKNRRKAKKQKQP